MQPVVLRGPILNPQPDGTITYFFDGALAADDRGIITYIGPWRDQFVATEKFNGLLLPPFIDCHIHIPQHPIRGRFSEGIVGNPPEGRLLASLNKNVFPAESCCSSSEYTERCVRDFLADTLRKGTVGGVAYMTVHPEATRIALRLLPDTWRVGLVLMNQNCPEYLRTHEETFERDLTKLAEEFGPRVIVTDRFAVACSTTLRGLASQLATKLKLRTQTHLNEQRCEKSFVEKTLYPSYRSYADVYLRDGLLDHDCILAHCIHMRPEEFDIIAHTRSAIAHCPVSNTLLGSGIMPLDEVIERKIPYAICTDVGASPTTSLLTEMSQFLTVHHNRNNRATPAEAIYRTTLAAADIAGLSGQFGTFAPGRPLSYILADAHPTSTSANEVIRHDLLKWSLETSLQSPLDHLQSTGLDAGPDLDHVTNHVTRTAQKLDTKIRRVVLNGQALY
jgi:guanine deaminase